MVTDQLPVFALTESLQVLHMLRPLVDEVGDGRSIITDVVVQSVADIRWQ